VFDEEIGLIMTNVKKKLVFIRSECDEEYEHNDRSKYSFFPNDGWF